MSVDITAIFRHDFYELDDFEKSMAFVKQTIDEIKKRSHLTGDYDDFCLYGYYDEKNKSIDINFRLPGNDLEIQLRRGFWQTWYGISYQSHIIERENGVLYVQAEMFDIARMLGVSEAWYSDDMFSQAYDDMTFEQVLEYAESKFGQIYEYPDVENKVRPFYHDDFSESKKIFEAIQQRCGDYELESIIRYIGDNYTVKRNGKYNLMHCNSFELRFEEDVDNIFRVFGDGYIVVNNSQSALFDKTNTPITDFVKGEFELTWIKSGYAVLATNNVADVKVLIIRRLLQRQTTYIILSKETTQSLEEIVQQQMDKDRLMYEQNNFYWPWE